jgi:hypothetical protein
LLQVSVSHSVPIAGQSVGLLHSTQMLVAVSQIGVGAEQFAFESQPTQVPVALQTVPPLSLQVVPETAFCVPQTLPVHVSVLQAVPVAPQSVGPLHCTHLLEAVLQTGVEPPQSALVLQPTQVPVALQTVPPLSLQVVPWLASLTPHVMLVHVLVWHSVDWAGQSLGDRHPSHMPLLH